MDECHSSKWWPLKLLVLGIVLILVRLYTAWDIWVVIGVLMIIKAVIIFVIPMCYKTNSKAVVRKR